MEEIFYTTGSLFFIVLILEKLFGSFNIIQNNASDSKLNDTNDFLDTFSGIMHSFLKKPD